MNINAVDFGSAFLPQNQNPNLVSATPGGAAVSTDLMRPFQGYARDQPADVRRLADVPLAAAVAQPPVPQRRVVRHERHVGALRPRDRRARGCSTTPTARSASAPIRQQANDLLNTFILNRHVMKGNFVWDMPDLHADGDRAEGDRLDRERLAAVRRVDRIDRRHDPDHGRRRRLQHRLQLHQRRRQREHHRLAGLRRPRAHRRRPRQRLQQRTRYKQFNTAAFQGPLTNSTGLESGAGYMHGCFQSLLDLAIARNIHVGGSRNLQLRVEMFNAPNSAIVINRNTTHEAGEPDRSGDDHQSALRRERQRDRLAVASARRRLRRRDGVSEPTYGAGPDAFLVLTLERGGTQVPPLLVRLEPGCPRPALVFSSCW